MDSRILKSFPREDYKSYKELLVNSKPAFEVFKKFLESELMNRETKPPDYKNPSWAYEQADRNGGERILKEIIRVINSILEE